MAPRPSVGGPRPRPRVKTSARGASQDRIAISSSDSHGPPLRPLSTLDSPPPSNRVVDLSLSSSPVGPAPGRSKSSRRSASVRGLAEAGPSSLAVPRQHAERINSVNISSAEGADEDDDDFFLARRRKKQAASSTAPAAPVTGHPDSTRSSMTQALFSASFPLNDDDEDSSHSDSSASSGTSVNAFGKRKPKSALPEWTRKKPLANRRERSSSVELIRDEDLIALAASYDCEAEDEEDRDRGRSKADDDGEGRQKRKRESLSLTPPPEIGNKVLKKAQELIGKALGFAAEKDSQLDLEGSSDKGGEDADAEPDEWSPSERRARDGSAALDADDDAGDQSTLDPALAMLYRGQGEREIRERARQEDKLRRREEERRWEMERAERARKEKDLEEVRMCMGEGPELSEGDSDLDLDLRLPARARADQAAMPRSKAGRPGRAGVGMLSSEPASEAGGRETRRSSRARASAAGGQQVAVSPGNGYGGGATQQDVKPDIKPALSTPAPAHLAVKKEKVVVLEDSDKE